MSEKKKKLLSMLNKTRFPLSSKYDPEWVVANEMGPNVLWMTEALSEKMDFKPGMRVLDLGCGTALSSIFLAKEFGLQVWASELWLKPADNLKRIQEAGVADKVFPIQAEAHSLPFADGFFDAIVSMNSYHYFGTDVHYLEFYMLKLLKLGAQIGIISPASPRQMPIPHPVHLKPYWFWMNSIDWWKHHWMRNPDLIVEYVDALPDGNQLWIDWHECLKATDSYNRPEEEEELEQLKADKGRYLSFVRMVARKK